MLNNNTEKLITNFGQRLQKLKEQKALYGLDTPPSYSDGN